MPRKRVSPVETVDAAELALLSVCLYVFLYAQEEEKNKIQNDLRILTERLSRINESLARKVR